MHYGSKGAQIRCFLLFYIEIIFTHRSSMGTVRPAGWSEPALGYLYFWGQMESVFSKRPNFHYIVNSILGVFLLQLIPVSIRGQGGSGWGGDWFGSDPLSKRVLHFRPDPLSKSIFVSRTPSQNQYKLSFPEEKQ